jgi:hypothetical protein
MKMWVSIGGIDSIHIDETETADIASHEAARMALYRRVAGFGALSALVVFGIITVCVILWKKRKFSDI